MALPTYKSNKIMKLSIKQNRLSMLPRDTLFTMCDYLDSFSRARLRFTSMTTHIDMMGCPLDLIQIATKNKLSLQSPRGMLSLVRSCSLFRFVKRQATTNLSGCGVSQQLQGQLIGFGTAYSDFTESQLSLLGIGRSWSITGIQVRPNNTTADFMEMCDILNKHNVNTVKRLDFWFSDKNKDIINKALCTCDVAENVEDLSINGYGRSDFVNLKIFLPSFKRLCHIHIQDVSIDGNLNDFIKYSPQIEELELTDTNITGDISCLAQFKNIRYFGFARGSNKLYGDIGSLSSCVKLTHLTIDSKNITGNISSLITLRKLKTLYLDNTKVEGNIESLLNCVPKLSSLTLWENSNLKGELILTGNVELEYLHVCGKYIHLDLSSLTHLKKLKECYVSGMPQLKGDISVMSGLTKLETLHIIDCPQVEGNINSLATFTNLKP